MVVHGSGNGPAPSLGACTAENAAAVLCSALRMIGPHAPGRCDSSVFGKNPRNWRNTVDNESSEIPSRLVMAMPLGLKRALRSPRRPTGGFPRDAPKATTKTVGNPTYRPCKCANRAISTGTCRMPAVWGQSHALGRRRCVSSKPRQITAPSRSIPRRALSRRHGRD